MAGLQTADKNCRRLKMSIKSLSKETIKLINSTQVISSIYSAVKELVENSLDAQAQNIEVNLVDNGLSLIEVKDNGFGICREDAKYMALSSYTSKISDFNDLELLSTYGFRGEGLTAVCQVSDVTVCTKTANAETMICYTLDNEGHVVASDISHGLTGTTVQMRNLFRNMPVRRNILNNKKRINQEIKAIEVLLKTYAICKSSIRFMFRVNSNTVFTKPSCKNITEAMKCVLGIQLFAKLTYIKRISSQAEIQLFIPKKEIKNVTEVSQAGLQFLCVNDRPIKSKEIEKKINKRISEYFNQTTSNSRKFIFCVTLKVDPTKLDVNLEPSKDKVFLQNEAIILDEIDESLLTFYEIKNSQSSTQSDIENINFNKNTNELEINKEKEKEWPAFKKRKLNSQSENTADINVVNKNMINLEDNEGETTKIFDYDFLRIIREPTLSDSDSNDADNFSKNKLNNNLNVPKMINNENIECEDSESFCFGKDIPMKNQIIEETLSQLPKVDLGDDFSLEEILNKSKKVSTLDSEKTEVICNQEHAADMKWSKGQVPGLQGGITIGIQNNSNNLNCEKELIGKQGNQLQESEPFDFQQDVEEIIHSEKLISNDNIPIIEPDDFNWEVNLKNPKRKSTSIKNNDKTNSRSKKLSSVDSTQTKIPFAGDNACLSFMGPSAFAMYCATERFNIVKKHPELSPAEVAVYMNKQWKEFSPEEREYYRDLANQHNESISNKSISQTCKKPKSQPTQAEREKNKKQFLSALGNMKTNKAEVKNESMIMRTFVPWNISLPLLSEKFRKPVNKVEKSVVGSLNSILWIVKLASNLFVFDITELHAQLNVKGYDINEINPGYVKNLLDQWFVEKNDMSIFHPFHSIQE